MIELDTEPFHDCNTNFQRETLNWPEYLASYSYIVEIIKNKLLSGF